MSHYRVLLRGQNFWLRMEEGTVRMGFLTVRFVKARDAVEAEHAALELFRREGKLAPLNDRGDPPRVFVDEIDDVDPADVPQVVPGLVFFPDEREADA
jgi:hypothetical protein